MDASPGTPRPVASRPRRAPADRIAYPVLDRPPRPGVVAQLRPDPGHQPPHQAARVGPGLAGVLLDDRLPRQVVRAAIDQGTRGRVVALVVGTHARIVAAPGGGANGNAPRRINRPFLAAPREADRAHLDRRS